MKLFLAAAFAALSFLSPALRAGTWSGTPWTADASTGIAPARTYWAYSFGSAATAYVNGVTVTGIDGGDPAVAGRFSVSGISLDFHGDTNDLTALGGYGSAVIGGNFIYNGAPGTITLEGLTVGTRYIVSIYGVGFDAAPTERASEFYSDGDSLVFNENVHGNDKGLRVDYDFTATATTRQIILTPLAGNTFHIYGLALHRPAIMVTSQLDSGNGSLRQAVADAASDDCILIDPVLAGEQITLTTPIGIFKSLSIDGSLAPGCRISGNHQSRIFSLQSFATTFHDRFYNLTLVDGNAGFSGGGAISNVHSNITVSGCTFTGNAASFGGAIKCDGNATLLNTTISGNTASMKGGAYQNVVGTTEFKHCTISNNSAPACGGILDNQIADTLLKHTIVSGNANGDLDNTTDGSTTFASFGGNIIGTGEQLATFVQPGDQVGANPGLLPLASNGGLTPTMLPGRNFEAIDSGVASDVAIDQRGYLRDSSPDSGAVERGPGATVFTADDSGGGSLRDRIDVQTLPDSYINFSPALDGQTITLFSELYVPPGRDIEIDASFMDSVTISGGGIVRVFFNTGALRLNALKVSNGRANEGAAVFNSSGKFSAVDCNFNVNSTTGVGGAIFSNNGSVDLSRCALFNNSASDSGALWFQGNEFKGSLVNCTVANNGGNSGAATGAMSVYQGSLDLIHTTVTENNGHGFSGGIYLDLDAHLNFDRCIVAGNHDLDSPNDDFSFASGTISTPGPNLIGNNGTVAAFFTFGDLVGSPVYPRVPLLGPGIFVGKVYTTPLLPGSPAINAALVSPSAIDQRGIARSPVLPVSDLGAVEFFPLGPLLLPSFDGDTIPDILEAVGVYPQLSIAVNDSALDTDGDGMTDAQEIGDSTDPLDSNSYFHITHFAVTAITLGSTSTELDFTSVPGLSYEAEVSATLDFSSARVISLGEAQGPISQYAPFLSPIEKFLRVRRVGAW